MGDILGAVYDLGHRPYLARRTVYEDRLILSTHGNICRAINLLTHDNRTTLVYHNNTKRIRFRGLLCAHHGPYCGFRALCRVMLCSLPRLCDIPINGSRDFVADPTRLDSSVNELLVSNGLVIHYDRVHHVPLHTDGFEVVDFTTVFRGPGDFLLPNATDFPRPTTTDQVYMVCLVNTVNCVLRFESELTVWVHSGLYTGDVLDVDNNVIQAPDGVDDDD
uniref:p25 protein n=1 Tax=Beet necrotic yellow vein virus TaxID=31721 RepID=E2RYQ4_9VIRU|nr:p25 protein [Beet necrotic yellow vein virus]